jgi:hypothetical protein
MAWNTNPTDTSSIMNFDILGPKGTWKIKSSKGVKNISIASGQLPAKITAEKIKMDLTDIQIVFEFLGESFTDEFGKTILANKPYLFSFNKFFQPIAWEVNFFSIDTSFYNPLKEDGLFSPLVRMAPFKSDHVNKLDYAWWGGIKTDIEHKQFITIAEANTNFTTGNYELSVTWDDAVRIYVDEKLVLNEWNPALYKFDESPNKKLKIQLGGMHHLRVEHLELGGFATLSVKLKKL